MKIAIIGFSGTGKSTLARKLSSFYAIPVLHLDAFHFKENWEECSDEEMTKSVTNFLNTSSEWIIEGNYIRIYPQRFYEADLVIYLAYNRFVCLKNVIHRYRTYKKKTRLDMAKGCEEKLDYEFITWVFYKGRSKQKKRKYQGIVSKAQQGLTFKNRKQLNKYLKELGVKNYEASM